VDLKTQQERAETFRRMHHGRILVLPNAWDAASATVLEAAGFSAIATTSAGVANSLGYPDGQQIGLTEMAEAVRRIVESVSVPVTADMEGGYGETEESAVKTVHAAVSVGAIGINLEDGVRRPERRLIDVDLQVRRIRAARDAAVSLGVPIVINARTDVYLAAIGEPDERLQQGVKRGNAYLKAGADCIFVPAATDPAAIGRLAREISGPINILAMKGVPPVAELEALGVARVSVGSSLHRAAMGFMRRAAKEFLTKGIYDAFTDESVSYADLNGLLVRQRRHLARDARRKPAEGCR
jgi:2-methylisocitrate lyase-like PEP mutase family enzyme